MKPSLRVLAISHTAHRNGSGRLRYDALNRTGAVDLLLMIPEWWSEGGDLRRADPVVSDVPTRPTPVRLDYLPYVKWYAHWYKGLARTVRSFRPDVLALWEEPWSVVACQALMIRNLSSAQTAVVLETEQNIHYRLPPPFQQMRRYSLAQADWLVARSEAAASVCRKSGYRHGYSVVPYSVDTSVFAVSPSAQPGKHEHPSMLRLGYVGRIVKEKGLFTIIRALVKAPNASLTIVGQGPAQHALEQEILKLDLRTRVTILPPLDAAGVARFMRTLDALLLMSLTTPTWKEQFGRVIIEAQACGTPVIGSDSGEIPAVIGSGGWVVGEGNIDALAELLRMLSSTPEEMTKKRSAALSNATRFSANTIAEAYLTAVQRAAEVRVEQISGHVYR